MTYEPPTPKPGQWVSYHKRGQRCEIGQIVELTDQLFYGRPVYEIRFTRQIETKTGAKSKTGIDLVSRDRIFHVLKSPEDAAPAAKHSPRPQGAPTEERANTA